jgi:hypothetical protein
LPASSYHFAKGLLKFGFLSFRLYAGKMMLNKNFSWVLRGLSAKAYMLGILEHSDLNHHSWPEPDCVIVFPVHRSSGRFVPFPLEVADVIL